ncbi:MAG: glycosyltransferase [Bacteroidetes bacterium]|nr:glycosyltransferase [Fibrella sp.]
MKILLCADWFYPASVGGPANAIYWQAKALTEAGHDVTVVATSQDLPPSVPLNRWLTLACGRVIYTRNPHFYLPLVHSWYAGLSLRRADVVHVNSLFYPSSLVLVVLARLFGKRVIWSPHGELSPYALRYSPRRKKVVLTLIRLVNKPVVFHATCWAEAGHIRDQFGPDVIVVELPIRLELPVAADRTARPYLLFIGRLHPIKAIDRLLDALSMSTLFRTGPYTLTIAGPDANGYRLTLIEQIRTLGLTEKVSFIGPVQGEKEQLYADALVTILPSHSENFGLVVIESLAQGTPVIASTGTPWRQLETERAGSWVANDPGTLRQAIDTYLTMPADIYEQYRTRAAELARRDDIHTRGDWERLFAAEPGRTVPATTQSA